MPLRVRHGSWAEFVSIGESCLINKPDSYSFAEAAALPMSALVAFSAVKAAGFFSNPVVESVLHKTTRPEDVEVEVINENQARLVRRGCDSESVQQARVAVVGASSTIGLMVLDMLVSRGVSVVGVSSATSAPTVLANGAVAVLDRNKGGLEANTDLVFDVIIDCVGGQEVEDSSRKALDGKGHFVTIVGPGESSFGDVGFGKGAKYQMAHALNIASRSIKSVFSSTKYTLASMPFTGGPTVLKQLLAENIKSVLDSEVEMFNQEAMIAAVTKVNSHKTRGRLVLIVN